MYDARKHDAETILQNYMGNDVSLVTEELGDKVEKVFEYTGVKALVKYVFGEECGCDERKENLNLLSKSIKEKLAYAFTSKVSPLTLSEYEYLESVIKTNPRVLDVNQQARFLEIYNRVFRATITPTGCQDCWRTIYGNLRQLVKIYNV
jgi:hypothetical protein